MDDKRLAGLIQPVAAAAGMDLETVRVSVAGKRRLVRVIVDSDNGVSLDDAADISREISAALDASDIMGEIAYTLEVSSPGVDRPLTEPRHWRRAVGRLVKVKAAGAGPDKGGPDKGTAGKGGKGKSGKGKGDTVQGRIAATDSSGVTLEIDGKPRDFAYDELGPGAVQVEFGRIPDSDDTESDDTESDDTGGPDDGH